MVQKQIAAAMFATTKYHQIFGIKLSRKMLSQVVEKMGLKPLARGAAMERVKEAERDIDVLIEGFVNKKDISDISGISDTEKKRAATEKDIEPIPPNESPERKHDDKKTKGSSASLPACARTLCASGSDEEDGMLQQSDEEDTSPAAAKATTTKKKGVKRLSRKLEQRLRRQIKTLQEQLAAEKKLVVTLRNEKAAIHADREIIDDERAQLYDALQALNDECVSLTPKITATEGGAEKLAGVDAKLTKLRTKSDGKMFAPVMRALYMRILADGESTRKINALITDVCMLVGIELEGPLMSHRQVRRLASERLSISHQQTAQRLLSAEDRSQTLAHDGARKFGHEALSFGVWGTESGPGSQLVHHALDVMDLPGGTAVDESQGFLKMIDQIVADANLLRLALPAKFLAENPVVTRDMMLKKFGWTPLSDSASTAQATSTLCQEMICRAAAEEDATEAEIQADIARCKKAKCFLHKAMNLVHAALSGGRKSFQLALAMAKLVRRSSVAEGEDDDSDPTTLPGHPQAFGRTVDGNMGAWAVFKLLSSKSQNDKYRRCDGWDAVLKDVLGTVMGFLAQQGNRELAWTANCRECLRLIFDPEFGCCRCPEGRVAHPSLVSMCADVQAFEEDDDGNLPPCVICYIKAKYTADGTAQLLNVLELCVISYLTCLILVRDWVFYGWVHEQIVMPFMRIVAKQCAVDARDQCCLLRHGLALALESPLKFLTGEARVLDDWAAAEVCLVSPLQG